MRIVIKRLKVKSTYFNSKCGFRADADVRNSKRTFRESHLPKTHGQANGRPSSRKKAIC